MDLPRPPMDRPLPDFMLRSREKYPRAWAPWTEEEDALLRELVGRSAGPDVLSEALGRGPGGIASRKISLGLERRHPRAGKPVPQMGWVPEWHDHLPEEDHVRETAGFWGVRPEALWAAMDGLSLDQWTVFVLRYGLSRRCSYTVEAVAELMALGVRAVAALQRSAEAAVLVGLRFWGERLESLSLDRTLARRRGRT